jgi:hypothetical protein
MIRKPQISHRGFTTRQQQAFFYSSTRTRSRTNVPRANLIETRSVDARCVPAAGSRPESEFVERRDVALHRGQVRLG